MYGQGGTLSASLILGVEGEVQGELASCFPEGANTSGMRSDFCH